MWGEGKYNRMHTAVLKFVGMHVALYINILQLECHPYFFYAFYPYFWTFWMIQCISDVMYWHLGNSMLCDVAWRNHTADIIFHNSCSSSHSCKQYRLAFNSPPLWTYKVHGSHASASALFICSTKSGVLLYRWQKRLVQILPGASSQQLTIMHVHVGTTNSIKVVLYL